MKAAMLRPLRRAMAAAATLTGKRFGLLVASSVVATSAIVASAMTGTGGSGAMAALIGRSLASNNTPTAVAPAPAPSPAGAGSSAPSQGGSAAPVGGSPAPAPEAVPAPSAPAPEPAAKEPAATPSTPPAEAGRVKHVFVISLASPGYEQSLGGQSQMPYLSATLRPQGELLSNYSLLEAAALPNEIATISGQPPNPATTAGCSTFAEFPATAKVDTKGVVQGAGCVYPVETQTFADQLSTSHFTWRAYMEGMVDEAGAPDNCVYPGPEEVDTAEPGGYATNQNPFVHFHSLLDLGDCSANDLPIDHLTADLRKAEKTPNFSYIAPTPCDAGATGQCPVGGTEGPASADAFLSAWVPKILASPAYKADGLLIVNFAAANPPAAQPEGAPPAPVTDPLHVGALLLSPFVTPGSTDAAPYNPYSVLRSGEDLFGLEPLALAAPAKTKSFAPSLLEENGGD